MISRLLGLGTAWAGTSLRDLMFGLTISAMRAVFAAVSLGFGTFAAYLALTESLGAPNAAAILCAAYAIVAIAMCLIGMRYRRIRRRRSIAAVAPAPATDIEALVQSLGTAGSPVDQRALMAAMQVGRNLSPTQLLLIAVMGGFVAGRKLGK